MKITGLQWHHYRLPFRSAFTTAHGVMTAREGIILEVKAEHGISGLGEIAPLPSPGNAALAEASAPLPLLSARLRGKELDEALDMLPTVGADLSRPPPIYRPSSPQSPGTPVGASAELAERVSNFSRPPPIMNFTDQGQQCHPERSEGSQPPAKTLGTQHMRSFASLRMTCLSVLRHLPILVDKIHYRPSSSPSPDAINRPLQHYVFIRAALCGLEIALLDALGKAEGRSISTLLAPPGSVPHETVAVNAVIGAGTIGAAVAAAQEACRQGFRCVKLKVGLSRSLAEEFERVAAVRDAIGPEMHLRLDANEAWELEEAIAFLSRCAPYDVQYVEQPLKARDLAGMRALRQAMAQAIPIAADEALDGLESARLILENEAADVLVIKPQLAGGLRVGQQIIQEAAERGVRSVITSTLEAGIGVAAALHLAAASPSVTLECGLATLPLLADDLLVDDLPVREGTMPVPTEPGLGVALDREALLRYSGTLKEG